MGHQKDDDTKQSHSRRTTLKTLLTGGSVLTFAALPTRWVKPVVDSVVLPTHAQTSPTGGGGTATAANGFNVNVTGQAPGWLDRIIPTAHAGVFMPLSGFLCIESPSDGMVEASYDTGGDILRGGPKPVGMCITLTCPGSEGDVGLTVTSINGDGSFDFMLFPGGIGCDGMAFETGTTNTPCNVMESKCESEVK